MSPGARHLWLHLTDDDGGHRTVPAEGLVRLVSTRGNTGIEANVSTADMAALGAVEISVEVGTLVTLFPESVPDDPNPITAAEGAFAKGPARRLAAGIFDSPSSPLKKALLTGFHSTAKHIAAKAVSPSSETMRTI